MVERANQDECDADLGEPSSSADSKLEANIGQAAPAAASTGVSKGSAASKKPSGGSTSGDSSTGGSDDQGSTAGKKATTGSMLNSTSSSSIPAGDSVKSKKGCASWWAEAVGASWAYDWYVALHHFPPHHATEDNMILRIPNADLVL